MTPSNYNKIPLLEMTAISKSFPGVQALDDVSIKLYHGEVLALVGENGAGFKVQTASSCLMTITTLPCT